MTEIPVVDLGGGVMPMVGFGTWQLQGQMAYEAARHALQVGYRHIDTATMYRNEDQIGRAIADSGLDRADLFVTTKLPPGNAGRVAAIIAREPEGAGRDRRQVRRDSCPGDPALAPRNRRHRHPQGLPPRAHRAELRPLQLLPNSGRSSPHQPPLTRLSSPPAHLPRPSLNPAIPVPASTAPSRPYLSHARRALFRTLLPMANSCPQAARRGGVIHRAAAGADDGMRGRARWRGPVASGRRELKEDRK
jgi:hypothetical protein